MELELESHTFTHFHGLRDSVAWKAFKTNDLGTGLSEWVSGTSFMPPVFLASSAPSWAPLSSGSTEDLGRLLPQGGGITRK